MALEAYLEIKTPNSKVTVIGSNPTRRELILGFEDGSVQTFDHETGEIIQHCYKHRGWVTALAALPESRSFFSSGNDSTLVTYNGCAFCFIDWRNSFDFVCFLSSHWHSDG